MMEETIERGREEEKIKGFVTVMGFCGIPLVLLVGFITIGISLVNTSNTENTWLIVGIQQTLPVFLALGVLPFLMFYHLERKNLSIIGVSKFKNKYIAWATLILVVTFLVYLQYNHKLFVDSGIFVVHYAIIAISEEILVRGIITYELNKIVQNKVIAIVISAVIFALVFHSTDGVLSNLLWRVPFAVIMSILLEKTGTIWSSVTLHWIWNVLLTV